MDTTILVIRQQSIGSASPVDGVPALDRIIVPLDGSELALLALDPAMALARRTGARVELITTRTPEGPPAPVSVTFLDDIAAALEGVETRTVPRPERDPSVAIDAMLDESDESTLIVMSSHGAGRLRRAVLGSVAESVVARVAAPVVIVGPRFEPDRFGLDGPIIVAHDKVHQPDLDHLSLLAACGSARISLLEVALPDEAVTLEGCSVTVEVCGDQLRESGFEVTCEVRPGDEAHDIIIEQAILQHASFIAATTKAESGARRISHGSVAARLVHESPVPVLVMASPAADNIVQV